MDTFSCVSILAQVLFVRFMLAAIAAPVVAWVAGTFSGTNKCNCVLTFDHYPEPSSGVLELLREQLQRCGPEQLRASAVPCPAPQTCPLAGFDWGAFAGGLLVGVLVVVGIFAAGSLWAARPSSGKIAILDQAIAVTPAWRKPPNAR